MADQQKPIEFKNAGDVVSILGPLAKQWSEPTTTTTAIGPKVLAVVAKAVVALAKEIDQIRRDSRAV